MSHRVRGVDNLKSTCLATTDTWATERENMKRDGEGGKIRTSINLSSFTFSNSLSKTELTTYRIPLSWRSLQEEGE